MPHQLVYHMALCSANHSNSSVITTPRCHITHTRDTAPTEAFIDALCGHGGLEHVVLRVKSLTAKSIPNILPIW